LGEVYAKTGLRGVIYCSPNFWATYMANSTWFAQNGYSVLWIAHWTSAEAPSVPASNWSGNGWTFWQYTSSGSVPGIGGRVDLDRFNGLSLARVLIP
jgi:GH25 family lysozyme M1 (1,4-beta-N-acetylmuramidase)